MAYKKVFICDDSEAELSYNVNGAGNLFIEMGNHDEDISLYHWVVLNKKDVQVLIDDLQSLLINLK